MFERSCELIFCLTTYTYTSKRRRKASTQKRQSDIEKKKRVQEIATTAIEIFGERRKSKAQDEIDTGNKETK